MFDLWDGTDTTGLLCSTHYSYFGSLAFFFFRFPNGTFLSLSLGISSCFWQVISLVSGRISDISAVVPRGWCLQSSAALMGQSPTPEPAQNKTLCPWPFYWGSRQTCFPSKLTLEAWGSAELHLLSCAKGSLLPPRVHYWWHLRMEGQVFPHITRPWAQMTPAESAAAAAAGGAAPPNQPCCYALPCPWLHRTHLCKQSI